MGAEPHDLADDDQRRRLGVLARRALGQGRERALDHALTLERRLFDQRRGRVAAEAVRNELIAELRQAAYAHVDDHGLPRSREHVPVQVERAVLEVPGDEHAGVRVVAVRERNAGVGRGAAGGGDSGYDFERHAGLRQGLDLLAAAAEDVGVAALEAHHALALARQAHHERVDVLLRQ